MKAKDLVKILRQRGCGELRKGKGSHVLWVCPGGCKVVIPMHAGEDIGTGLLHKIEKTLEPCLGKGWLK